MEPGRKPRTPGSYGCVWRGTCPTDMKLVGCAEDLLELDGEFFYSECKAVFPHRFDIWSRDGIV